MVNISLRFYSNLFIFPGSCKDPQKLYFYELWNVGKLFVVEEYRARCCLHKVAGSWWPLPYHRYFRACQPVVRCYDVITRSTRKRRSCCLLPSSRRLKIANGLPKNKKEFAIDWSKLYDLNRGVRLKVRMRLQPLLLRLPLVPTLITFSSYCRF